MLMSGDGMETLITALTSGQNALTGATLWAEVAKLAPIILMLFVFVFGWSKLSGLVRGGAKGKLKLK